MQAFPESSLAFVPSGVLDLEDVLGPTGAFLGSVELPKFMKLAYVPGPVGVLGSFFPPEHLASYLTLQAGP